MYTKPTAKNWVKASKIQNGLLEADAAATFFLKKFLQWNADLLLDDKLGLLLNKLKHILNEILENPDVESLDGAYFNQLLLYKMISDGKGAVIIDEHNALFKPIDVEKDSSFKRIPVQTSYFEDFSTWTSTAGVSFVY